VGDGVIFGQRDQGGRDQGLDLGLGLGFGTGIRMTGGSDAEPITRTGE
jgi:hypothetical protein